jgi:hypothetical protein
MQNRRGAGAGATIGSFFCFSPGTDLCRWSYLLGRQTGAAAVLTIKKGAFIVKTQKAAGGKNAGKLSDAVIEKRYLDLQKLRDAVRTAEMNCAAQTWKSLCTARLPETWFLLQDEMGGLILAVSADAGGCVD